MTPEGIASVNDLESVDALIALVKLTSPDWPDAVRLVQSPVPVIHAGEVYDPAPFDLGLPSSEESGQPALEWSIGNAGNTLIDRLDLPGNAARIKAGVRWVFHTRPEVVEFGPCNLFLASVEVVRDTVSGSLSVNRVEERGHGRFRFNPATFRGLG